MPNRNPPILIPSRNQNPDLNKYLAGTAFVFTVGAVPVQLPAQNPSTGFSGGITLEPKNTSEASAGTSSAPPAPVSRPWWTSAVADSELLLLQVGTYSEAPANKQAIALYFSQVFASDSGFEDQLAVYWADTGKRVAGTWRRAPTASILYFKVPEPGRYLVRVRAGLRDAQGHTFNHSLSGPIEIPATAAR